MKHFYTFLMIITAAYSFGQSKLTDPKTGCQYVLPWTCDECEMNWTGDCIDKLPNGEGILTVSHENEEIMHYEGEMKNGNFDGQGIYWDAMNQLDGMFENGNFVGDSNPHQHYRNTTIDTTTFNKTQEWEKQSLVTKQIDNLYFTFPAEGYAFEHRDELVKECIEAIQENLEIIHDSELTEFTRIRFVTSKKEMLLHADLGVTGAYNFMARTAHMVISNDDELEDKKIRKPPIQHELMHMVSMTAWGPPPPNCTWLNEGLATYANNDCLGYSLGEIYRFFLENDRLYPIEALTNNFYETEEMIGYHQSAYIVEYLIANYGIEKLQNLWQGGFANFENIYGITVAQMVIELNAFNKKAVPNVPDIDWEIFMKGCK